MQKIIVTGANGQLGKELQHIAANYKQFQFLFFSKEDLDISNAESVETIWQNNKPNFCINCAAYTAVDKAETESGLAFEINSTGVKHLASTCNRFNSKLIHISSDYVFDGTAHIPYKENYQPNPMGIYAKSKLQGEQNVLEHNSESIIIRTSWVYSSYGNNFVKTMIRLMNSKPEINVVDDQYGSPTWAADLARAILSIIQFRVWHPGVYHYSNNGIITWHQFAQAIKELINSDCKINSITTDKYPTAAKRPHYSVLDKEKIQSTFLIELIDWNISLEKCIRKITDADLNTFH
jgi:dTDP-4-dehydrorhamnose reductase